jgi:hypothetical protein
MLLDKPKQAKFQWFQNPSQMNGDNMENVKVKIVEFLISRKGLT